MRSLHKITTLVSMVLLLSFAAGCEKDDKLKMVTTESSSYEVETTTVTQTTEAVTEVVTEAASEAEKNITIDEIYDANNGENILKDKKSCCLTKQYVSNGENQLSESYFLGVDENGSYLQVFSNSDGDEQILDNRNRIWYVVDKSGTNVLICPDDGGVDSAIFYQHNNMIFSKKGINGDDLTISNVYRQDGKLVVEMKDTKQEVYKYFLDDQYKVTSCEYYTANGALYCEDTVSVVDAYTLPENVKKYKTGEYDRIITLNYSGDNAHAAEFYAPSALPVKFTESECKIYTDEAMTNEWTEDVAGEDGKYPNLELYIKE